MSSLFEKREGKYSDIVSADSIPNAKKSISKLRKEYYDAKTQDKRDRIKKVALYASNRIDAMSKNPNYNLKTKAEKRAISKMYKAFYIKLK